MSPSSRRFMVFLAAFGSPLLSALEPARCQQPFSASLGTLQQRNLGQREGHLNHIFQEQTAVFRLGTARYAIAYKACTDKAHSPKVAPLEGYIGMPQPSSANWYHSGFLFIALNGQDIGTAPLTAMMLPESEDRGILDLVWLHDVANVRVRFLGLPGRDHLFCEIALEPKQEVKSIAVGLRCYPSFFTAHHKRDGARRVQTPAALVQQGQRVSLSPGPNWWAVYYDEVFDVARGEGDGPCAMLVLPQDAATMTFAPGSYSVETSVAFRPQARRLRFAFWDFKGVKNADALARVRDGAGPVRAELETLDFTPQIVRTFDPAALRAEVEDALTSPQVHKALGAKLAPITEWLSRNVPRPITVTDTPQVEAELRLLQSAESASEFLWDVRLAQLLTGL